ncbi:MAG: GDP-mannose 4,6-dehydratase [Bacteroidota bacterium]
MKNYLITGGAGFIGSNLTRILLSEFKDTAIINIDNYDPYYSPEIKRHNTEDFKDNPRYRFINIDLALVRGSELASLINEPVDVIIHLAAKTGVRPSVENPLVYQHVNVIGTQNILDFAKIKRVKQFVFASSSGVYGVNNHYPWKEDEQLLPISPYAQTKLSGEMLGHVYSQLYGIRFIALRFFTVYGPCQRPDLAIHKFTKAIMDGELVNVYGNGNTSRDYTFITDIVNGIVAATNYDQKDFDIFNLGNNYSISLNELIHSIEEITGNKALIRQYPDQPGDVPKTFANISKAKQFLNYNPHTSLKDGLQQFYNWYKNNYRKSLSQAVLSLPA